jgi:hypothetical protein
MFTSHENQRQKGKNRLCSAPRAIDLLALVLHNAPSSSLNGVALDQETMYCFLFCSTFDSFTITLPAGRHSTHQFVTLSGVDQSIMMRFLCG